MYQELESWNCEVFVPASRDLEAFLPPELRPRPDPLVSPIAYLPLLGLEAEVINPTSVEIVRE